MAEILVVDDERAIREGLKALLCEEGFDVRVARNGEEALARFREKRPDLVLLDVMMSKRNGFSVCEEIRRDDADTPIIFLTGLDGETQEIKGMNVGGDDYILKSAPQEVMLARIRRSLERRDAAAHSAAGASLWIGRVLIDFAGRTAKLADGTEAKLTGCELDIIRALDSDRTRYFTLDELDALIHGANHSYDPGTLRSQISRLKTKLGRSGDLLRSERYLGYRLLE